MFYSEGGGILDQAAQRGGGMLSLPGSVQGRVEECSETLDLVEDIPAHCREIGVGDL